MLLELNVKLNFGIIFACNPKLCIYYKHWIHYSNKTMKQFYISTNKTCVLNLIKGDGGRGTGDGGPQLVGRFFMIHTFAMESPSCFSPLIHEKEKKNKNLLKYMCVCEYINSFLKYCMKIIKMLGKKLLKSN
jgi:hypothetical protein